MQTELTGVQLFWAQARATAAQIEARIIARDEAFKHHPAPKLGPVDTLTNQRAMTADGCYIIAVNSILKRTQAIATSWDGRSVPSVCLVPTFLAGQRIAEESHRLANAAEVEAYLAYQRENLALRHGADNQGKGTMTIKLPDAPKEPR